MKTKTKPTTKYPSEDTVRWDYGYKQGALQELRDGNKAVSYCRAQAQTEDKVVHVEDCPTLTKKEAR